MSDDEYDDRRRDKFRPERSDRRSERENGAEPRGNSEYYQRRNHNRDGYEKYEKYDRGEKRRRSSPPPSREHNTDYPPRQYKRPRPEWDNNYQNNHHNNHGGPPHWQQNRNPNFHHQRNQQRGPPMEGPPPHHGPPNVPFNDEDILLSFKQWVMKQEDNINEDDACKNYKTYKTEFKKKQLQEFFVAHKDEEWFRDKFHPDASSERHKMFAEAVKQRYDAWEKLVNMENLFEDVLLDITKENNVITLLERAVMLMEGIAPEDVELISRSQNKNQSVKSENGNADAGNDSGSDGDGGKRKREKHRDYDQSDDEDDAISEKKDEGRPKDDSKGVKKEAAGSDEEDGELNDKEDELEARREEIMKRASSKYSSIFMRSLPPTISRQDISNMCKKFDGFVRVAFSHPQDDRFHRRCWVTFDRSVNIKDICWNLNNIRLKDVELNPVVNRDLQRRCRPMSGLSNHSSVMHADIKNLIQIIRRFDKRFQLFSREGENVKTEADKPQENKLVLKALKFIEDHPPNEDKIGDEVHLKYDKELSRLVDLLVLYCRLVHSVDYYNHAEYRNEDEMPNRCGIIHVRGEPPMNAIMPFELNDHIKKFNEKATAIMSDPMMLKDGESKALGMKDDAAEVKKFIELNTQQLGVEKYLCPLSGKKFKGPDFVRKHIMNKHAEKVDAVRKEVAFFNQYLVDPRRPMENTSHRPMPVHQHFTPNNPEMRQPRPPPPPPKDARRDSYTSRPVVEYRDLDAPDLDSVDIF